MDFTLPARILTLTVASALANPAPETVGARWRALDAGTAAALEALAADDLEAQRAGAFEVPATLSEAELLALEGAQQQAPELEDQRGGDVHLTDREVQIILWTAAAIAVIFILA